MSAAEIASPGPDADWAEMLGYIKALRDSITDLGEKPWVWGGLPTRSKEEFLAEMSKVWDNTQGDKTEQHFLYVEDDKTARILANCGVGPNRVGLARFIQASVMMTNVIIAQAIDDGDIPA
jgi:hypothetical protein